MVAPVTNYSVHMNARPALAGGAFTAGYAVCNPGNAGWVVASTANLAGGTVDIGGIALETSVSGGSSVQVLTAGYCPPEVIGTISGTGGYVNVTSTGALTRSATVGSATVGKYQSDGGVIVDLGLQDGGAVTGNATAIQGVSVTSASADRSYGLFGDGTNIRSRLDIPDFRDWSPVADGTDQSAKLQSFLDTVCRANGTPRVGRLLPPANGNGYAILNTVTIYDDTAGGNACEWTLDCGGTAYVNGVYPHLRFGVPCPTGSTATLASVYTPGTGQQTQVWNLGATAVSQGVTVANKELYIGLPIRLWGVSNVLNHGEFFIVGVAESGGEALVTVYNPRAAAPGTDANNGSIRWRIYTNGMDIRSSGFVIDGLLAYSQTGRFGPMINIGEPFRAGARQNTFWTLRNCVFAAEATKIARYGLQIAKDIVPRSGNTRYAVNGNGDMQVASTTQIEQFEIDSCKFLGLDEMDICHSSPNAQSKEGVIRRTAFTHGGRSGNYGSIGYGCPRNTYAAGPVWNSEGSPHVKIYDPVFGAIDTGVLWGGSSAGGIKLIQGSYTEGPARVAINPVSSIDPVTIRDCVFSYNSTSLHPSKEIIALHGEGPLRLDQVYVIQNVDGLGGHIMQRTSANSKTSMCCATGLLLWGTPGWTGRRGRLVARRPGAYRVTAGDTLTIQINAGATRTITATANNFARVGQSTIDWNEIESWQIGRLFNGAARAQNAAYDVGAVVQTATGKAASPPVTYIVTTPGTTANTADPSAGWTTTIGNTATDGTVTLTACEGFNAWGEWDHHPPSIQTMLDASGSVQAIGGTLMATLDFSGTITFSAVQTQLSKDTQGFLDVHPGGGNILEPGSYELSMFGALCTTANYSGGTHLAMPSGTTRYGQVHAVYNELRAGQGGSFTACLSGGPAKTLTLEGGGTTIASAVTSSAANDLTIADPRCTVRSLITVEPTNAAAITLGRHFQASRAAGSFVLTFPGPPVGTETYRYTLTEPT